MEGYKIMDLEIDNILIDIRKIINESKKNIIKNVNTIMLHAYWSIGKRIVEEEQKGKKRAEYGSSLIKLLSKELTNEYGKGFSKSNLFSMRKFYIEYQKFQTLSGKLSWSHYLLLLNISDSSERSFYEHECENSNWSVRELERQIDSQLFKRLLLSKGEVNKNVVLDLAKNGITYQTPDSFIKDPMVLEFVGMPEIPFYESNLEKAILEHIEQFLLELGRGFMFVGTQQRISIAGMNYYVDMVFYNKILKAYVLIDLKMNKLKPENFGQMNMYVNYYKNEINEINDSDPIGIILCAEKDKALAKMSIQGINNNIYAAKYTTVMPDIEILQDEVYKAIKKYNKNLK
jgi:predicted nuclease of restriction endonuclease-like (RecB) superfamily